MNLGLGVSDFSPALLVDRLSTLAVVAGQGTRLMAARGQALFDPDNAPDAVFLLLRGLVKLVYLTPDGDERIKSFIVDKGLFAMADANPAFGAVALEASELLRLPPIWVKAQIAADDLLGREYPRFLNWVRERKSRREQALLCDSAEARLRRLREEEAELAARLPQGDIARYLGITPIAFSRIKRRIGG